MTRHPVGTLDPAKLLRAGRALACLTVLLCGGGCASIYVVADTGETFHASGGVADEEDLATRVARTSAAHDLRCPSVAIVSMYPRETIVYGDRPIVVEGCGEQVTYQESCDGYDDRLGKAVCKQALIGRRPAERMP